MAEVPWSADRDVLAAELQAARARLAALDLPPETRARLQRQFIAVCDALKAPGAGTASCRRRLDGFTASLESAVKDKFKDIGT